MARGVDGLTAEELRKGRDALWSPEYTRAFLDVIPAEAALMCEIGCGLGRLAREVLPRRPGLSYLGVAVDPDRIAGARIELDEHVESGRARLSVARGEALPLGDDSADVVITAMTLQHIAVPLVVLAEVRRTLRPGGVAIAAEPDNFAQQWYFDGPLEAVTATFTGVVRACRRARWPRDLCIGPRVPSLFAQAGLVDVSVRVHTLNSWRHESAGQCAARWLEVLDLYAVGSGLAGDDPDVAACRRAMEAWLGEGDASRTGYCGALAPIIITTGRKPG